MKWLAHVLILISILSCSKMSESKSQKKSGNSIDIQGNRGARGLMPENSIPAFLKAVELGVTTLELDVVVTKDQQVVVSHESYFSPDFCLNPDGSEISPDSILENNIYVMIFTIIFSLIFGAGAVFVLAWNATVIASAMGIFTNYKLSGLHYGLVRYMIHGIPEIAAYFIAALAGCILGAGFLRNGIKDKKFYHVLENTILLLFLSLIVLVVAAFIEVYFTPILY